MGCTFEIGAIKCSAGLRDVSVDERAMGRHDTDVQLVRSKHMDCSTLYHWLLKEHLQ